MCEEAESKAAREEEGLRGSVQWVDEGGMQPGKRMEIHGRTWMEKQPTVKSQKTQVSFQDIPGPALPAPGPKPNICLQPLGDHILSKKLERDLGYNLLSRLHFRLVICQAKTSRLGVSPLTGHTP